jgi:hypothetical protein
MAKKKIVTSADTLFGSNAATDWTLALVWNKTLEEREERPVEPRERMWAGELGKSPLEVFLKMRGIAPSNPPNPRSLRKFEAGNFFEWVVSIVLKRVGILKEAQKWTMFQYPGLVPVSGKIDFVAGGKPDYKQALRQLENTSEWLVEEVQRILKPFPIPQGAVDLIVRLIKDNILELPDIFTRCARNIVLYLEENYPEGLEDRFLEIKSVSAFMMNSLEIKKAASRVHRLQILHYLKSENYKKGLVVYICRDDLRMMEIPVNLTEENEKEYRDAIEAVSKVYNAHRNTSITDFLIPPDSSDVLKWEYNPAGIPGLPELEKPVVWDEDMGKFARNWNVEYSNYLTMLYGFPDQLAFEEYVMPTVGKWNRVMKRIKTMQTRLDWLAALNKTEADVQSELLVVEGRKARQRFFFVMEGDQKIMVPDEIKSGFDLKPEHEEAISEITKAGYEPYKLALDFVGDKENNEE